MGFDMMIKQYEQLWAQQVQQARNSVSLGILMYLHLIARAVLFFSCKCQVFYQFDKHIFIMSTISPVQILKWLNEARAEPKKLAEFIKKQLTMFVNDMEIQLAPGFRYRTNEGKGAWQEAVNFLMKQPSLHPYILNEGLTLAAEGHAIDISKTGAISHVGSDGRNFSDRIYAKCQKSAGMFGENIGTQLKFEGRDHALHTVKLLIIDDGIASRGHRANMLSKDFKYVGISTRLFNNSIYMTVFNFHADNVQLKDPSVVEVKKKIISQTTDIKKEKVDGAQMTTKTTTTKYEDGSEEKSIVTFMSEHMKLQG